MSVAPSPWPGLVGSQLRFNHFDWHYQGTLQEVDSEQLTFKHVKAKKQTDSPSNESAYFVELVVRADDIGEWTVDSQEVDEDDLPDLLCSQLDLESGSSSSSGIGGSPTQDSCEMEEEKELSTSSLQSSTSCSSSSLALPSEAEEEEQEEVKEPKSPSSAAQRKLVELIRGIQDKEEAEAVAATKLASSNYWGPSLVAEVLFRGPENGGDQEEEEEDDADFQPPGVPETEDLLQGEEERQFPIFTIPDDEFCPPPPTNVEMTQVKESLGSWAHIVQTASERKKKQQDGRQLLPPSFSYSSTSLIKTKPSGIWNVPLALTNSKKKNTAKLIKFDYEFPGDLEPVLESGLQEYRFHSALDKWVLEGCQHVLERGLNHSTCKEFLSLLLYAEEYSLEGELENFRMQNAFLQRVGKFEVRVEIPGLVDKSPNVIKGDLVIATKGKDKFMLSVKDTMGSKAILEVPDKFCQAAGFRFFHRNDMGTEKTWCQLDFTVNRHVLKLMHRAIGLIEPEVLAGLYPSVEKLEEQEEEEEELTLELFNDSIASNKEQLQAITEILHPAVHPHPYVVFGPPGTGKTVTVVEAIKQVWLTQPTSRVIVTAPSNAACDLLASRLIGDIPQKELLRLLAPSREGQEVAMELDDIVKYGKITAHKLNSYRIVVVTLTTAARLFNANVGTGFYTHVFIDEAGQANEAETLIPLAGLVSTSQKSNGGLPTARIVLSGDPCQLGPVVVSRLAEKHGLECSMLERLMTKHALYAKGEDGVRDPRCITKLVKNFRSHADLLITPSKLFYDDELVACADKKATGRLCTEASFLPTRGFPMVFHGIKHPHAKAKPSPSLYNEGELAFVKMYVQKLVKDLGVEPADIGVVSPYRRQVRRLKEILHGELHLEDIMVGSTEEFQGQEREAMIISTVRSSLGNVLDLGSGNNIGLGFLSNAKRFNVAVTRAKAMMIVVGDPYLLARNKFWRKLIEFAFKNGGYTGVEYDPKSNWCNQRQMKCEEARTGPGNSNLQRRR